MPSARTRMQLRLLGRIVLVVCAITPVFNLVTTGEPSSIVQGLLDGLVISGVAGGYMTLVRDGLLRIWMQRWNFTTSLAINSAVLVTIFLGGRSLGQLVTSGPQGVVDSFTEPHLLPASLFFVAITVSLLFVFQMNRMIGPGVLRYFVMGRYHRPHEEDRVFLFLDLRGSTELVERLGSARYYGLLRRFVDDLSEPVLASRGEIYQYAGDEVVVTWTLEDAIEDAHCLRCYLDMVDTIAATADDYERDFGAVPRVRAGLEGGSVLAGELGDLKQEIVYVGDPLHVAARLQEHAKAHDLGLIASDALLARMKLPDGLEREPLGKIELRGREEPLAVSRISRSPRSA